MLLLLLDLLNYSSEEENKEKYTIEMEGMGEREQIYKV
jgi:hypothetical protein